MAGRLQAMAAAAAAAAAAAGEEAGWKAMQARQPALLRTVQGAIRAGTAPLADVVRQLQMAVKHNERQLVAAKQHRQQGQWQNLSPARSGEAPSSNPSILSPKPKLKASRLSPRLTAASPDPPPRSPRSPGSPGSPAGGGSPDGVSSGSSSAAVGEAGVCVSEPVRALIKDSLRVARQRNGRWLQSFVPGAVRREVELALKGVEREGAAEGGGGVAGGEWILALVKAQVERAQRVSEETLRGMIHSQVQANLSGLHLEDTEWLKSLMGKTIEKSVEQASSALAVYKEKQAQQITCAVADHARKFDFQFTQKVNHTPSISFDPFIYAAFLCWLRSASHAAKRIEAERTVERFLSAFCYCLLLPALLSFPFLCASS